jgi:hypothetical protein
VTDDDLAADIRRARAAAENMGLYCDGEFVLSSAAELFARLADHCQRLRAERDALRARSTELEAVLHSIAGNGWVVGDAEADRAEALLAVPA